MSLFSVIGNIIGGAGAIASVIPGGQIASSALTVAGGLLSGKTPTASVSGAAALSTAAQPQKQTFFQKIMSPGPLGVPWLVYGIGAAGGAWFIWRKVRHRR